MLQMLLCHAPAPVLSPSPRPVTTRPTSSQGFVGGRWRQGAATALGLSSVAWKRQRRATVEGSTEAARERLPQAIRRIAAELRKLESITSAYSQTAPFGFPQKSTVEGLAAMNDLEHLINGELELDNQEARLLVASLQHEKSEFGQIVSEALHILRDGKDHPAFPAAQKIIDLLGRADAKGDTQVEPTPAWPLPPSESDSAPNAQNARWPILAALDQTCKDGERSLGLAEAELHMEPGQRSQPKAMTLKEILKAAPSHKVLGLAETPVTGVVDVMERAIPGDLLLVEVDDTSFDQEFINSTLEEADSREVSAVVFLAETVDLKLLEVSWEGEQRTSVKAATVLPQVTKGQALAVSLARVFFATEKIVRKMMKIAVVGDHLEVRSASWLLFKMLEIYAGASKTGFINNRCSMIAQSSLDTGMLTRCTVEEILAGMNAAEVDFCVAEVLASDSFDHVDFDLVVDLSGDASNRISAARLVSPKNEKSAKKEKGKVSYSFETPRVQVAGLEEYAKLTKNEVAQELASRGVDMPPASTTKKELLEKLAELLVSTDPEPRPSKTEKNGQNLHASFTSVGLRGLELNLMGLGMDEQLSLPSLGLCSPNAITAAICAAYVLAEDATAVTKLPQIPPPPATLELFTAEAPSSAGIAGVLHQGSSPKEVKLALEAMAEVMSSDPKATFTVVFGCDGEVSRGDRAKYAWALAEHCDRIVLTSASPGVEPPMQIIEDILEAIRGYRTWKKTKTLLEVFVVSDRADAIKLGAITPKRNGEAPDVTLVFGSDQDSYDATDEFGQRRSWLFHDRRLLTEALELSQELREDGTLPAWLERRGGKPFVVPGRSLHWSYGIEISSDGHMQMFL